MLVKEIPLKDVECSEWNTRKSLPDAAADTSIDDLANSIEKQGLLTPITVIVKPDGKYAVIAGQRRMMALRKLGWTSVTAIIRHTIDEGEAIALSLVENVHREDMNPRDKAMAYKALLDRLGSAQAVSDETGINISTVRKYLQLLDLSPAIQDKLARGEIRNTDTLARLSRRFAEHDQQDQVLDRINSLPNDLQAAVIRLVEPDLDNLHAAVVRAQETAVVRMAAKRCPFDCPEIPEPLKQQIAWMIEGFKANAARKAG